MSDSDTFNQIVHHMQFKLKAVRDEDYSNALLHKQQIDVLHQQLKKNPRHKLLPIVQVLDKREELQQRIREVQSLKISSYKREEYTLALQYKRQLEKLEQELKQMEAEIAKSVIQPTSDIATSSLNEAVHNHMSIAFILTLLF
jgi:hypothetical protein